MGVSCAADLEPLEKGLHANFFLEIEKRAGHMVAGQEISNTQRVGAVAGANDAESHKIRRRFQELPAGDKRLENHIAEPRVVLKQTLQILIADRVSVTPAPANTAHNGRVAGDVRDVPGELTAS